MEDKKLPNISISPLAKRIATLNNLDISKVKGTGPRGRIIKKDLDSILNVEK